MSKLRELIEELKENKIETAKIRDKEGLINALSLLEQMIGHKNLKESVTKQVRYLIQMLSDEEHQQQVMLNTVIYGPPGIGKTTIGVYLSKIWSCLGYLRSPSISMSLSKFVPASTMEERMEIITYLVMGIYFAGALLVFIGKKIFQSYGMKLLALYCVLILGFIAALLFYLYQKLLAPKPVKIKPQKMVYDTIRIVSRSDFVSEYLGQTAIKTNNLLRENIGKVLLIDEAYSLYEGRNDMYGMEALTALNKFLSEHPRDIIVIFAGYKELMQETIFKVQPGLSRRCMWVFECTPYTPEELFLIFKQQVTGSGWSLLKSDEDKILELIRDNYDTFKSFGGDTERLCNFSKIEHCDKKKENYILDESDVRRGIRKLKNNHAIH
jgi:DNA polymerase III delta prime subunit